jgi:gelsolin
MIKYQPLNIADTNMANFGTDLEKNIKAEASKHEPAWTNSGKVPGIQIWRIEQFHVHDWPKKNYGSFYSGDSYILLHTYKKKDSDALHWQIHFWLGTYTSIDEAGTAAYKTVELDDFLGGAAVQYREVQGSETDLFTSYFGGHITIWEGGIDSGFKHVEPEKYNARLLQVKGKKTFRTMEVPMDRESLCSNGVFILDNGLDIIQWNGVKAPHPQKFKANLICKGLQDERCGKPKFKCVDENDPDEEPFWTPFGGKGPIKAEGETGDASRGGDKVLMELLEESGAMKFKEVAIGSAIKRTMLDTTAVFVLDNGFEVYTWIGKAATTGEKRLALSYAQQYLKDHNKPANVPICKVLEGGENDAFETSFHNL